MYNILYLKINISYFPFIYTIHNHIENIEFLYKKLMIFNELFIYNKKS